jgi:hypothetical protein
LYKGRNRSKWIFQLYSDNAVAEFQVEVPRGGTTTGMTAVHATASIISGTNPSVPKIRTGGQVLKDYIKNPQIFSLACVVNVVVGSLSSFHELKQNTAFEACYGNKSEHIEPRPLYTGVFDEKLRKQTRIECFIHLIRQSVSISRPFHSYFLLTNPAHENLTFATIRHGNTPATLIASQIYNTKPEDDVLDFVLQCVRFLDFIELYSEDSANHQIFYQISTPVNI